MAYSIIWSKDAGDELFEIVSYIKYRTGINAAKNIYSKIKTKIEKISDHPKSGKAVPELKDIGMNDIYQIIEGPWKIYYKIEGNKILVLSVLDGRRNMEEILYKKVIDGKIK